VGPDCMDDVAIVLKRLRTRRPSSTTRPRSVQEILSVLFSSSCNLYERTLFYPSRPISVTNKSATLNLDGFSRTCRMAFDEDRDDLSKYIVAHGATQTATSY